MRWTGQEVILRLTTEPAGYTGGNAFRTQKHERNCSEAHQKNSPANFSQGQYRIQWHTYILKASHQFGSCRNFLQAKKRFVIPEDCKHEMECVEQDRRSYSALQQSQRDILEATQSMIWNMTRSHAQHITWNIMLNRPKEVSIKMKQTPRIT